MIKDKIAKLFDEEIELEHPANPDFGDYSTNYALKKKIDPKEIVKKVSGNPLFEKVEVVNGFVNFFLSPKALQDELKEIKEGYGDLKKKGKVQVEFISANPTGPLTVGNARGGPFGDVLANVLTKAGYDVKREYYVNDYGKQVERYSTCLKGEPRDSYGVITSELREKINDLRKKIKNGELTFQQATQEIIGWNLDRIKLTIKRLGIKFDRFFRESELHKKNKVDTIIKFLEEKNLTKKEEEAIWFKTEQFGDNRDRVIIRKDKTKTYLASDIAYHQDKFQRGFDKVINIWGADHHGDIAGLQAGVEAIGYKGKLDIILMQFVTLTEGGVVKKMSKRAGDYVTMDELLDEVGKDAVRFFFLQKSPDTHLNFDIELAKEQSKKNPVFYVQYSFARISSIIKNSELWLGRGTSLWVGKRGKLNLLTHPSELNLIKCLIKYPEIIEDTVRDYQVQRLPHYSLELASKFHQFYENCKVINYDDQDLTYARWRLIEKVQIVLKDVLTLIGVEAPEKM